MVEVRFWALMKTSPGNLLRRLYGTKRTVSLSSVFKICIIRTESLLSTSTANALVETVHSVHLTWGEINTMRNKVIFTFLARSLELSIALKLAWACSRL